MQAHGLLCIKVRQVVIAITLTPVPRTYAISDLSSKFFGGQLQFPQIPLTPLNIAAVKTPIRINERKRNIEKITEKYRKRQ